MFRQGPRRAISALVLVTFTSLELLQPLNAWAQLPSAPRVAAPASGGERYSGTLNEIQQLLKELAPQAAAGRESDKDVRAVGPRFRIEMERARPAAGAVDAAAKVRSLRGKLRELREREAEIGDGFRATEKHIRDKRLPAEILARHQTAVADYENRKSEFAGLAQSLENAAAGSGELQTALADLNAFMAKYPSAKTSASESSSLPWGAPKPVNRKPYTSPTQFKTSRLFGDTVKLAQLGSLSGITLPPDNLPATPTPEDTAATEDAPLSAAIRAQAQALENHPVKIYNWVRPSTLRASSRRSCARRISRRATRTARSSCRSSRRPTGSASIPRKPRRNCSRRPGFPRRSSPRVGRRAR